MTSLPDIADDAEDRRPSLRLAWNVLRAGVRNFVQDRVPTLAAALAFYTSLSLAPFLLVVLWALSFVGEGGEEYLVTQAEVLLGEPGRETVASVLAGAEEGVRFRGVAGTLSLSLLALSATAVFAQLQQALNLVWEVEARPGAGVWGWVRKRLLSLGMVGTIAFLLLVSLAASTLVGAIQDQLEVVLPSRAVSLGGTVLVFTLLFSVVFAFLPDVVIAWRDVLIGAAVSAVLFALGKYAIGVYLARKGFGDTYGAAGSIVAVLAWVYFSSVLVLFGAELTQEWARQRGRRLVPDRHAVRAPRRAAEARRKEQSKKRGSAWRKRATSR